MARRAKSYIPSDIQKAAKGAGLSSTPVWYVGRANGHEGKQLKSGLGKVVADARAEQGLPEPTISRRARDPGGGEASESDGA